jgi:hypothetical protein
MSASVLSGRRPERVSGPAPSSNLGKRSMFEVRDTASIRSGEQGEATRIE